MQIFPFLFFLPFCTKTDICIFFVFCVFVSFVITFVPIKIQTYSAPQNDRLNLSFVKDVHVVGERIARNGRKMAIGVGGWGRLPQTMILASLLLNGLWMVHLCNAELFATIVADDTRANFFLLTFHFPKALEI